VSLARICTGASQVDEARAVLTAASEVAGMHQTLESLGSCELPSRMQMAACRYSFWPNSLLGFGAACSFSSRLILVLATTGIEGLYYRRRSLPLRHCKKMLCREPVGFLLVDSGLSNTWLAIACGASLFHRNVECQMPDTKGGDPIKLS